MIAAARMAEMDAEEDGRCFMDKLDLKRYLLR